MVTFCMAILLHPALRAVKLLGCSPLARMPQARCDRELFVDAAPFASALDASLRSMTTFLVDARLLSALLTFTLVLVYAYLASAAHLIGLKAIDATASLPSRIE
eukprot:1156855-Pleurochrysis_carterae.AAC.1